MGNVTVVNEVQNLNKRIEKLNTERTRIESQSELLKKQLNELISEYASDFGTDLHGKTLSECKNLIMAESKKVFDAVKEEYDLKEKIVLISEYASDFGTDLHGKTLSECKNLIMAESKKVFDAVKEEYDLKEKIVSLIEKGDIDEANVLLGIKPEVEEVIEEDNSISNEEDNNEELDLQVDEGVEFDESSFQMSLGLENQEESAVSNLDLGLKTEEEDNNEELDLQVDEGVEFDESSFQMSLGLENQEESAVSNLDLGLKTEEVVEEEPESFKIAFDGDLDVEDDSDESDAFVAEDDDDDFDFGFGDMLKGGKF